MPGAPMSFHRCSKLPSAGSPKQITCTWSTSATTSAVRCTRAYQRLVEAHLDTLSAFSRYDRCGCVDPLQWSARYILLPGTTNVIDAPLCNLTDPCYDQAASSFRVESELWAKYCPGCQPECVSVSFITKSSSLRGPPEWMMPEIKAFVESSAVALPANWSSSWVTEIQQNHVTLQVQCESYRVENFSQTASLGPVDVLSNVGGQTGLWIGISFLSLMEVVEMLYRLIRYQCFLVRQKLRRRNQVEHNDEAETTSS